MAPRIKLFNTERQEPPKTIHMVLEDMQSNMLEIEASAIENPNIAPVNTPQEEALLEVVIAREEQDLNDISEVVDSSLPAIGALEDTAYAIAPAITQTRPSDLALVRQIAVTAADSLGLDAAELVQGVDANVIGQPLVLEGFKEKAVAAARAVWNAILNVLDHAWTLFQSAFRRTAGRLKKLNGVVEGISKNGADAKVTTSPSMKALTETGSLAAADVEMVCRVFTTYYRVAVTNMNMTQSIYGNVLNVVSRVKAPADILKSFKDAVAQIVGIYGDADFGGKLFVAEGDDLVAKHVFNGNKLKYKGLAAALNVLKTDPLAAATAFASVQLTMEEVEVKLPESINYRKDDFVKAATNIGTLVKEYNPSQINHLNAIVRKTKRDVQSMADRILVDWTAVIEKAPENEQAALRPYLSAISQLVNKQAHLCTQLYSKSVNTLDAIITGGTQLLEQGVAGKTDPKQ